MQDISFKQYKILRKLYKSKEPSIKLNPHTKDYEFLLNANLIVSEHDFDGPVAILEPNGITNITSQGISEYNFYRLEFHRHWQNIFIPQTLNIIVSIITTVITYFILEYLKAP